MALWARKGQLVRMVPADLQDPKVREGRWAGTVGRVKMARTARMVNMAGMRLTSIS